ncbi:MAG TPA: ABC transporter ATP-binding protein, partial [Burkholderiales bacterium]|nr:ABC transporter ATP-binding protein [Burkholderiales bacterium]
PNGAGKSTLVNLLCGDLAPSAGRVVLADADIGGLPPDRISRLGVGRSYQKTNVFAEFTVFENCRLAAQSRLANSMHLLRPAHRYGEVADLAREALRAVGLEARERSVVADLSHGERRQVEIAMVLATRPRLLLLDEPLAGMGAEESRRITGLLKSLAPRHAMLLVEHDMDAVFALADTLTVMVNGKVLESGPPAQVRASRAVQEAYLGADSA